MHVYVWEHIVSLYYRNCLMDVYKNFFRDEVLMVPHLLLRLFGKLRPGVDPGRGKNRSVRGPFSKGLLLQIGRLQQQNPMHGSDLKSI